MQKKKDIKTLFTLCLWMLISSVFLLIRMNIVSVNNIETNILGQMEWFDLIDEIIITAFIRGMFRKEWLFHYTEKSSKLSDRNLYCRIRYLML